MPTLRLADYLSEDLVLCDLPSLDKRSFLAALVDRISARLPGVEKQELLDRILAREEQQSTGIGGGLALPHALVPGLEESLLAVGRPLEGLEYAALDSEPVDLIFLLLSPEGAEAQHLRILARLARLCAAGEMLNRLRAATGPAELLRILREEDSRHAY